ncbi:hypothetical protein ABZ837_33640 [Streptomyces sp. NPDC047197]|uniref:hypothetical protein n=1 Tax=Streptomyces sp. NPDC047197 TaxID=3155477 RepID=UPI0033DB1F7F
MGTAPTILVDATLIRVVLLAVAMRLAGRGNWWAPGPLRRLHQRLGLHEGVESGKTAEVLQREYA